MILNIPKMYLIDKDLTSSDIEQNLEFPCVWPREENVLFKEIKSQKVTIALRAVSARGHAFKIENVCKYI